MKYFISVQLPSDVTGFVGYVILCACMCLNVCFVLFDNIKVPEFSSIAGCLFPVDVAVYFPESDVE